MAIFRMSLPNTKKKKILLENWKEYFLTEEEAKHFCKRYDYNPDHKNLKNTI